MLFEKVMRPSLLEYVMHKCTACKKWFRVCEEIRYTLEVHWYASRRAKKKLELDLDTICPNCNSIQGMVSVGACDKPDSHREQCLIQYAKVMDKPMKHSQFFALGTIKFCTGESVVLNGSRESLALALELVSRGLKVEALSSDVGQVIILKNSRRGSCRYIKTSKAAQKFLERIICIDRIIFD